MKIVIREQQVFAIRRNNEYWQGRGWHPDLRLARILPRKQCERTIRIDIGMSGCELIEIMPIENRK